MEMLNGVYSLVLYQELSQSKLKAFAIGRTSAGHKPNPFKRKKEEREEKKKVLLATTFCE